MLELRTHYLTTVKSGFSSIPTMASGGKVAEGGWPLQSCLQTGLCWQMSPLHWMDTWWQIMELLAKIRKRIGVAILFITHDLGLWEMWRDRLMWWSVETWRKRQCQRYFQHAQNPLYHKLLGYWNTGKVLGHTHAWKDTFPQRGHLHHWVPMTIYIPVWVGDISSAAVRREKFNQGSGGMVQEPETGKTYGDPALIQEFPVWQTYGIPCSDEIFPGYMVGERRDRGNLPAVKISTPCKRARAFMSRTGTNYYGILPVFNGRQMIFQIHSSSVIHIATLESEIIGETASIQKLRKGRQEMRSLHNFMSKWKAGLALPGVTPTCVRRTAAEGSHCQAWSVELSYGGADEPISSWDLHSGTDHASV